MKLGLDLFSLRRQQWTIFQHLDYAKSIGLDVVMIPDPDFLERLDDDYLAQVKAHADQLGLALEFGMYSICPSSGAFSNRRGTAVEQLRQMLHVARQLGSPYLRALLGNNGDRRMADISLRTHIDNMLATLRAARPLALDLGIKVAIENHAGDLQARELKAVIEEAGTDYVGACIDSGNPLWVAESPYVTLEHLAPHILMSHIRDSIVFEHAQGAVVQWVALGDGTIDMPAWAQRFREKCPQANFTLEIISSIAPRVIDFLNPEFWSVYPETPAWEFARFLQLVKAGEPHFVPTLTADWMEPDASYRAALEVQQRRQVEKSVKYAREVLGIGQ